MKSKENQGLSSFDFFSLVLSFAIILAISLPILRRSFQSDQVESAQHETYTIGRMLLRSSSEIALASAQIPSTQQVRGIASVPSDSGVNPLELLKTGLWKGETGVDPWGHPYHFRFMRNAQGAPSHLVVWSNGPDGLNSTRDENFDVASSPAAIRFQGDDLGSVIPVR